MNSLLYIIICTTLRGQIKGQCRAIFLILPCKQGNNYLDIAQEREQQYSHIYADIAGEGAFFDPHFDL